MVACLKPMASEQKFVFKNVVLMKLYFFILAGLGIGIVTCTIAYRFSDVVGAMMVILPVAFVIMFILFRRFSKTVEISFDDLHINFMIDGRLKQYLKTELEGFYSFNYLETIDCTISMRFDFTDGTKMDMSDYTSNKMRPDPPKLAMLRSFLTVAEEELGFQPVMVNRARRFGKIGNVWFSRT
jgi:hypothetical protein